MTAAEKRYPDWVQEQRTRGTTVKKKGDTYYLYKRTPGASRKEYTPAVDTYIGIITPEGFIKSERKKISLGGIEVKEYGFSQAYGSSAPRVKKSPWRRLGGCPFHSSCGSVRRKLTYEKKGSLSQTGFPLSV